MPLSTLPWQQHCVVPTLLRYRPLPAASACLRGSRRASPLGADGDAAADSTGLRCGRSSRASNAEVPAQPSRRRCAGSSTTQCHRLSGGPAPPSASARRQGSQLYGPTSSGAKRRCPPRTTGIFFKKRKATQVSRSLERSQSELRRARAAGFNPRALWKRRSCSQAPPVCYNQYAITYMP